MKASLAALCLTTILLGCAHNPPRPSNHASTQSERLSDHYSREAVKSYELFDPRINGHVIMLVQLKTGELFPMLCLRTGQGVRPIAQSVFAVPGSECWQIMCEPQIQGVYALMRLELSRKDGALSLGGNRLTPLAHAPLFPSAP